MRAAAGGFGLRRSLAVSHGEHRSVRMAKQGLPVKCARKVHCCLGQCRQDIIRSVSYFPYIPGTAVVLGSAKKAHTRPGSAMGTSPTSKHLVSSFLRALLGDTVVTPWPRVLQFLRNWAVGVLRRIRVGVAVCRVLSCACLLAGSNCEDQNAHGARHDLHSYGKFNINVEVCKRTG